MSEKTLQIKQDFIYLQSNFNSLKLNFQELISQVISEDKNTIEIIYKLQDRLNRLSDYFEDFNNSLTDLESKKR